MATIEQSKRDACSNVAGRHKETSMNFNAEVMLEEFPFLARVVKWRKVQSARVERVDDRLASLALPVYGFYEVPLTGTADHIFLLDRSGELVGEVGREYIPKLWKKILWLSRYHEHIGEKVGDVILRCAKPVFYVVEFYDSGCRDEGDRGHLVLHKPPKSFKSVNAWLEDQKKRARKSLKDGIALIDAEAIKK